MDLPLEIVEAFYDMLQARVRTMENALCEDDWVMFRKLVHQIAGTGGSFGLPRLTEEGRTLEREIATGTADLQLAYGFIALCRNAVEARRDGPTIH